MVTMKFRYEFAISMYMKITAILKQPYMIYPYKWFKLFTGNKEIMSTSSLLIGLLDHSP